MKINEEIVNISYNDFQKWIYANRLTGAPLEDTQDFLEYLGYLFFHNVQKSYPHVTLDMLSACVFEGKELDDIHQGAIDTTKLN